MEELRLVPLNDYHADCRLLEVEPGASLEEIKQAYRDQTKVWHPDRFLHDVRLQKKAEEKIIQINLAYRRLCGLSPYEQPVLSPATPGSPSGSGAVFALRRALRNSLGIISKPFVWLIRKGVNITAGVFRWCHRERRSLAIAMSTFVLGLAFGVWLLPRTSETWVKINALRHATMEKDGTAQAIVAEASPAAPTMPSEANTSSPWPRIEMSLPSSMDTSSDGSITRESLDLSPGETNIATPILPIDEEQATGTNSTPHESDWPKSFGEVADRTSTARSDYTPISLVPHQSTLYDALPYSEVEHAQSKSDVLNAVPWLKQIHAGASYVIAQQQPEETPWRSPAHPAAMEPSKAKARLDASVTSPSAITWEDQVGEPKRLAHQAVTTPARGHRAPSENVIAGSAAKAVTIYAPRPDYPEEARSHRISGSGVCVVSIDPRNGSVTGASMAQTTGSLLLDKSVLRTLRTWKFKPGTVSQASIPVEFTREEENP